MYSSHLYTQYKFNKEIKKIGNHHLNIRYTVHNYIKSHKKFSSKYTKAKKD